MNAPFAFNSAPFTPSYRRTVGIIQARMGSSRLPGKVMQTIAGQPMLWHVVERVRRSHRLDHVLVATSAAPADAVLADYCWDNRIDCFRGSETDVLDRYLQAARFAQADTIVRLTADCPLHDGDVIDSVIAAFEHASFDYVSNVDPPTFPDGLDTEVFSIAALERAWWEATLPSEREHVTPYLRRANNGFQSGSVRSEEDLSHWRWTVDERADLAFVRAIYHALDTLDFTADDVIMLLKRHPYLRQLNAQFDRNEGCARSLQAERLAA